MLHTITCSNILHKIGSDYYLTQYGSEIKNGEWFYNHHGQILQWTSEWEIENKVDPSYRRMYPKVVASTKQINGCVLLKLNVLQQ